MAVRYPFCSECGAATVRRRAGGRERDFCPGCGRYYYFNPIAAAAAVLVEGGRILLARRASSVFPGRWYIPAGFCEADETIEECCVREAREETGLDVEVDGLVDANSGFEVSGRPVLGVYFRVRRVGGEMRPGSDVDRLDFFPLDAVPDLVFAGDRRVVAILRRKPAPEGRGTEAG